MGKFKKGDWVFENDAKPGDSVKSHGYFIYDVLPNGSYIVKMDENSYELWKNLYMESCTVEPRCTGWDWVLPEPANRFGLKVGDKVTFGTHDGVTRCCGFRGTHVVSGFDENGYIDGIARIVLEGSSGTSFHPYWFGFCQSDGSPLPPKPATKTVVLEEWCFIGAKSFMFVWKPAGESPTPNMIKTGVTRELEVPNE
jgi:hypothetical protein